MSKAVVEVGVRAVAETTGGCAVFLGNEDKVFVMFVDQSVGTAITMFMQGTKKERPLTHDLLVSKHLASARSEDRKGNRQRSQARHLFCETCPQRGERIATEEDHRDRCAPSDCIAMATAQGAPIYVSLDVWDEVEDMTEALRKMQEEGSHGEESDEEDDS